MREPQTERKNVESKTKKKEKKKRKIAREHQFVKFLRGGGTFSRKAISIKFSKIQWHN